MKANWWKLILAAVLIGAVVAVIAVNSNSRNTVTSVAMNSGPAEPVHSGAATEKTAVPAEKTPEAEVPKKSATPIAAAKPDSDTTLDKPKEKTQAAASAKTSAAKPAAPVPKRAPAELPKSKPAAAEKPQQYKKQLPKLVDLGATKCIPCRMMAPILEELKKEYEGKLEVVFIDVWEDRAAAEKYGIRSIPTQIFYDENGRELARHEGFMPKEDILNTFRDNGIEF